MTPDDLSGADVIAVGVRDTYVDAGIAVAQITWINPDDPRHQHTGLVRVGLSEGMELSRLLHRTIYVRRGDIESAESRFDLGL